MEYQENPVEKLLRQQRERIEAEKNKALEEKDAALAEKDAALAAKDAEIKNNKRNFIRSLYYDFHISKEEILEKYNDLVSEILDEILA